MTKKDLTDQLTKLGYVPLKGTSDSTKPGDIRVYKDSRYVTTINLKNGKVTWNGKDCTKVPVPDLMELVEAYNKTLEFDADTYCPDYRVEAVTEMRLYSTLEKCGFDDIHFNNYGGGVSGHSNGLMGAKYTKISGNHMYVGPYSWIELYNDGDSDSEKCKSIKSMTSAFYVTQIADLVNKLDKMGDITDKLTSIPISTIDPGTLEVTTKEGVDGIIALLENTVKRLKTI